MPVELEQGIGPYRIVSQLGRGGMATVYKAYQPSLDRFVALKVIRSDLQSNPDYITRFKREAKTIAKLDHPSIIPVYDIDVYDGALCLVMRYVEGLSLREALNRLKKPLAMPAIMHIMRPVTDALTYAHHKSILHRDVKPANIMLGSDGNVYLMDFGLALSTTESELNASKGFVLGTPYYISPEQAKGEPLDPRSDIYSLGIVLYELLTAQLPFSGESYDVVVYHQIFTLPPLPSKLNPQVSPSVDDVVLKSLAKDKNDRYYSASDMERALERAESGDFKGPRPASPQETRQPIAMTPEEQLHMTFEMGTGIKRKEPRKWPASASILVLALVILVFEIFLLFPEFRAGLRTALANLGSLVDQGSDAVRIVIGTISAYIATLGAFVILRNLKQRLPGVAFYFAVAFGVTLILALALAFLVLLLLNVL